MTVLFSISLLSTFPVFTSSEEAETSEIQFRVRTTLGFLTLKRLSFRIFQIPHKISARCWCLGCCMFMALNLSKISTSRASKLWWDGTNGLILSEEANHTREVQAHSSRACEIVSGASLHKGHKGSGRSLLLYRTSLVARAPTQAFQRNIFIFSGISKFQM